MPNYRKKLPNTAVPTRSDDIFNKVIRAAISSSNHPEADMLLGALRAKQYDRLLDWSERPSPQCYDSALSYFKDAQLSALLRKYPYSEAMIPGRDPRAAAVKKFKAAEHNCKRHNQRRRAKRTKFDPYAQIMAYARSYIEKVIGRSPDYDSILSKTDFTAGAAMGVNGNRTSAIRKIFANNWSVTPTALPYALSAMWNNIHIRDCILPGTIKCYDRDEFRKIVMAKIELVRCNKVTFVPKTAKTHRAIAIEPLLNVFVQKGIDIHLRKRLKGAGIDLSEQLVNQALAKSGSETLFNPYCTIDLAAASDSLSTEVVKDLLPPDWFEFLSDIRAPGYMLDNSFHTYEKFCSMGNGFCFPLQSLVFASICHACGTITDGSYFKDFSVYGDDIIVPQNVALLVIEVLQELGFKTNVDKTFICGPFRESCGADWYLGQDVRPVHFTDAISDVRQLFALHNSTLRSRKTEDFFSEVRPLLRTLAPEDLKLLRPGREPGDVAFSVPLDLAQSAATVSWNRNRYHWKWRELKSLPVPDVLRFGASWSLANATLLAAMRGSDPNMIASQRFTSRPKLVTCGGPYWDTYHGVEIERDLREYDVGCIRKLVQLGQL